MYTSNKSITLAIVLAGIASMVIVGVEVASVNADINNPKGDVRFQNTKTVIVNIKGGKDGKDGKDGVNGRDGTDGANGLNGKDGVNGTNGSDGAPGLNGINGTNGQDGAPGKDGMNGTNGADGRDGTNGTNGRDGVNGTDGRDAQATILLNVSNGQQIVCTVGAGANDIGCVDVNDNGTVIIPPNTNGTGGNQTGNGTGTGGTGNQTGNGTSTGNTTGPVQCQPGFHEENGACVEDAVIPPVTNETGNNTGPVVVDNSTGTVVIDNSTNSTG